MTRVSLFAAVAFSVMSALPLKAQSPAAANPKFEVASIRPCENAGEGARGTGTDPGNWSPGRLILNCQSVAGLINAAYVIFADGSRAVTLRPVPLEGGPRWIHSERYTINAEAEGNAKAEGNPSQEMLKGPMLQALLEDRFKLKLHRETREIPIYALTVAKGGPKLKPFKEGTCTPRDWDQGLSLPALAPGEKPYCAGSGKTPHRVGAFRTGPNSATVDVLAISVGAFSKFLPLDRPVLDKTGIAGLFDFLLEFAPDESTPAFGPATPSDDPAGGPSIFTAVQEQLGLKLECQGAWRIPRHR